MTTAAAVPTTSDASAAGPTTSWKPAGWQALVPCLQLNNAQAAVAFYERAFGAFVAHKALSPDGTKLLHASLRIEDSTLMLSDPYPEHGFGAATNAHLWLYVKDADAAYKRAVEAGAKGAKEVQDMFWGDRTGQVEDEFGVKWVLAQHLKDHHSATAEAQAAGEMK